MVCEHWSRFRDWGESDMIGLRRVPVLVCSPQLGTNQGLDVVYTVLWLSNWTGLGR